jgi:hypothetical protein
MSCIKVRFYESTMNGKIVGKKCMVSAAMRQNLDT